MSLVGAKAINPYTKDITVYSTPFCRTATHPHYHLHKARETNTCESCTKPKFAPFHHHSKPPSIHPAQNHLPERLERPNRRATFITEPTVLNSKWCANEYRFIRRTRLIKWHVILDCCEEGKFCGTAHCHGCQNSDSGLPPVGRISKRGERDDVVWSCWVKGCMYEVNHVGNDGIDGMFARPFRSRWHMEHSWDGFREMWWMLEFVTYVLR